MVIELNRSTLPVLVVSVVVIALLALGTIGSQHTPVTDGTPRVLTWGDWRMTKATAQREAEIALLDSDMTEMYALLADQPNPVAAQLLAEKVARHAAEGKDETLATAREAVKSASFAVRDWAVGLTTWESASLAVNFALALLHP